MNCIAHRGFVDRVHDAGLAVNAWTIRSQEAAEAVAAAGVDGLIADDPRFCAVGSAE